VLVVIATEEMSIQALVVFLAKSQLKAAAYWLFAVKGD